MKNPIKEIKEKRINEMINSSEEQRQRKERLKTLEEAARKQENSRLLHPIQTIKNKKEQKNLRKEIAAYDEKRKKQIVIGASIGGLAILFVILGIMSWVERKNSSNFDTTTTSYIEVSKQEVSQEVNLRQDDSHEEDMLSELASEKEVLTEADKVETESIKENENEEIIAPQSEDEVNKVDSIPEETNTLEDESSFEEVNYAKISASDLSATSLNDYAHITDESMIYLGNGEGVTITVSASAVGLTSDDILILYDEELLSVDAEKPTEESNKTIFRYYITGKKACDTQIAIITSYDYLTKGEKSEGFIWNVTKMNSTDGKKCYITPTGDKYHFSESCAGVNSISTTIYDVTLYEYEPCGKCAR